MVLLVFAGACSSAPSIEAPVTAKNLRRTGVAPSERPFLVDPLFGYPRVAEPDSAAEVRRLHSQLLREQNSSSLQASLLSLMERDVGFHPGEVLAAQAELVDSKYLETIRRLQIVLGELPQYSAALLALGRAAELGGSPLVAFEAYLAVEDSSPAAAERLEELRPRTLEIVYNRMQDAMHRGRWEAAGKSLERLRAWGPQTLLSWQASRELAVATEDYEAELSAVRELLGWTPEDRSLLVRRAELEVAIGEPGAGVKILRDLAQAYPEEPEFAVSLERAEFRWRLRMMPETVHELIAEPELSRSEFAALLYWVVPGVRYGRVRTGRIAVDILDHPDREAIARVVNLGLMRVDSKLHRFVPEEPVERADALASLLRLIQQQSPRVACLGSLKIGSAISYDSICRKSAACRLTESAADCLPRAPLSGEEGVEMVRRALRLMGKR